MKLTYLYDLSHGEHAILAVALMLLSLGVMVWAHWIAPKSWSTVLDSMAAVIGLGSLGCVILGVCTFVVEMAAMMQE